MATHTDPGIYIEEVPSGQHIITGVATSITAFIGWSSKGPVGKPVMVGSWPQYQATFGGMIPGIYLGYAVYQFFLNGGSQAYIVRLAWTDAITATNSIAGLQLYAKNPGAWGNSIGVVISNVNPVTNTFNLQVVQVSATESQTVESFTNLSTSPASPLFAVTVVDTDSNYITFTSPTGTAPATLPTPTATVALTVAGSLTSGKFIAGEALAQSTSGATSHVIGTVPNTGPLTIAPVTGTPDEISAWVGQVSGAIYTPAALPADTNTPAALSLNGATATTTGADGTALVPGDGNFETALNNTTTGYTVLGNVPIFNLLCVPGETGAAEVADLQSFCAQSRAFLIVDSAQSASIGSSPTSLNNTGPADSKGASLVDQSNTNSAFYFPWVLAPDPQASARPTLFPPCGFVAGIYASTDADHGVWKAPAGIAAVLTGTLGLQYNLTEQQSDTLNALAVNCLRQFPIYGNVVWGARTIAGADATNSQWKYVSVRRLSLFLESSLYQGTQWTAFEPNAEPTWSQVRLSVGNFMQGLFLKGTFAGTTPQQAYFVKCDAENNPETSVAMGIINITVGFAPLYPAEFVVIQIQQLLHQC
jgi:phage tail sheath protein FI